MRDKYDLFNTNNGNLNNNIALIFSGYFQDKFFHRRREELYYMNVSRLEDN